MKKNQFLKLTLGLVVAGFVLGSVITAQGPAEYRQGGEESCCAEKGYGHHDKMGGGPGIPNLTEDQKEKIKALRLSFAKQTKDARNQIHEKQARLRTLETANQADIKAIHGLIDEITQLEIGVKKKGASMKQDIRKLLNEDQRIVFDERAGQKQKMARHMMKRMMR